MYTRVHMYIMPVANSTRSHRESIAREMRFFHGETGPRVQQQRARSVDDAPHGAIASALVAAATPARRRRSRCNCSHRCLRRRRRRRRHRRRRRRRRATTRMRCVYVEKGLTALCQRGISGVGAQTLLYPAQARYTRVRYFFPLASGYVEARE